MALLLRSLFTLRTVSLCSIKMSVMRPLEQKELIAVHFQPQMLRYIN
ncbi:hypothetical protein [Microcoleus asticus]|nr:hypothetical protein [Microcoleus asticus]